MPVSDQHPLYTSSINRRQTSRDCVAGSDAVKGSTRASEGQSSIQARTNKLPGTVYLPIPNPTDTSQENQDRYRAYKLRAIFVNFTGHTKSGFTGMISRKPTIIELNSKLEYLLENADGAGLGLDQLTKTNIDEVLEVGQHGLMADFPASDGDTSAKNTVDLRARIKRYPAESIINWREKVIGSEKKLVKVVLAEEVEKINDDGFGSELVTNYRVLDLIDNKYQQSLYDEDEVLIPGSEKIIKKSDGTAWDFIPFEFSGAETNDPPPDKPPLYDIAEINLGHYRNSADFEDSSFFVGQPMVVMIGLTQPWVDSNFKGGLVVGSKAVIPLPKESDAKILQADPNQMPGIGMEKKEQQLMQTGAKIITDSSGVETAEAAKIRFAGQNSKLGLIVSNTEKSMIKVLGWVGLFMGVDDPVKAFSINKEFYEATINPQLLVANMQLLDRGVIAKNDIRNHMRKSGLIDSDRTDEDIEEEAHTASPI